MHELSIAQNIVEIIQSAIPEPELNNISKVRMKVGKASGVVPESLEFSFQAITSESPLQKARLEIELVPFCIQCSDCGTTAENEPGFAICEKCESTNTKVISGSELNVTEIELGGQDKEKK